LNRCFTLTNFAPGTKATSSARSARSSRNDERRAPPEDVRRTPRFENLLNTIADPKHTEHAEATEWHFGCYGKAFARSCFDELAAKLRISDIANVAPPTKPPSPNENQPARASSRPRVPRHSGVSHRKKAKKPPRADLRRFGMCEFGCGDLH
jgi:hypothetical protein